jgi:hypothetical protein
MKKSIIFFVLFCCAAAGYAQTAKKGEPRWESNLSLGYIKYVGLVNPPAGFIDNMNRKIAIVKSFWFYPFLPRLLSLGLSFDYVTDDLPLSLNAALNLPTKFIVPFVSAGVGASISGSSLQNYGGGIKFRTGRRFGLIAEYRHYSIKKKTRASGMSNETSYVKRQSNYFGAGIAYLY